MGFRRSFRFAALFVLCVVANALQAEPMRYPFDRNHSTIGFAASVMKVSKVTGKFPDFEGKVILQDPKDLTTATVEVKIQAASIDTGVPDRDEHLRSEDFFDTTKFPEITFVSKAVRKVGAEYLIDGTFTMHGVAKELTIPFKLVQQSDVLAAEAHLTINRMDYGVAWTRQMDDGSQFVDAEVRIDLYLLTRVGVLASTPEKPKTPGKKD
ncbi:MAG: YceI family protein [Thermoanaerobaculia bacterium]|nr:YceI family protein [Thermoanaerobaculia bacterium]